MSAKRWVLAARPDGLPKPSDFRAEMLDLPPLKDGEALIRISHASVDPGMRGRLTGDSYAPALGLGETVESAGIGEVVTSRTAKLPEGANLHGEAAFKLYDTYGFPLDLTQDAVRAKGLTVDTDGFDAAMQKQREMARANWAG